MNFQVTDNCVAQISKSTAEAFKAQGSKERENEGYFFFPKWESPEWKAVKKIFGDAMDVDSETIEVSADLFSGECKKYDHNMVAIVCDSFPDPGRKNPT